MDRKWVNSLRKSGDKPIKNKNGDKTPKKEWIEVKSKQKDRYDRYNKLITKSHTRCSKPWRLAPRKDEGKKQKVETSNRYEVLYELEETDDTEKINNEVSSKKSILKNKTKSKILWLLCIETQ